MNINKIKISGTTYNIQDENATKTVELTQAQYDALTVKDPNTFYVITDAQGADLSNYYTKSETSGATEISTALASKQDTLVSGTNIKTINNESILGEGNITIEGGVSESVFTSYSAATNARISEDEEVTAAALNALNDGLSAKQDTLVAGDNITISGNVISAEGGIDSGTVQTMIDGSISGKADTSAVTVAINSAVSGKADSSAVTQEISAAVSGKVDTNAFNTYSAATNARLAEDEEVTAAALNDLNEALSGKADTSSVYTKSEVDTALNAKQNTLESGTNIKTINNESILGSGNIEIESGGKAIEAGRGISITTGETADTVSFNLPLSSSTMVSESIVGGYFENYSMAQYGFAYGYYANCGNNGGASIALGSNVTANGRAAIALGSNVTANGRAAIALGSGCTANLESVSIGRFINTNILGEIGVGIYNVSSSASATFGDSGNTLFSVGNGTADNARHNAFEIRQNGDIYLTKDGQDVKLQDQLGGTVDTEITSASTNPVTSAAIYNQFGGLKLVKLSQSEYDSLSTKDNSTLYIIIN